MKSTDYILIQPTMVKDLLLSGNRLIIYALIHGFCKDGEHKFTGSINYISEWTNLSRNTVISVLKSLVDDGLITKSESIINNIKFCSYSVGSAKTSPVVQKTSANTFSGSEEIAPKKYNYNNIGSSNNIKEEEKELKEKFASFVKKYKKAGGRVRGVDTEFNDFSKRHKDWKEIIPYLDIALGKEIKERERARIGRKFYPEMKNLQTYLGKQRAWEMFVTVGEDISTKEYMPSGHNVYYDELRGFYYYTGFYMRSNDIMDGYTDEERPDGAKLCLNNARGIIQWNSNKKEWRKIS